MSQTQTPNPTLHAPDSIEGMLDQINASVMGGGHPRVIAMAIEVNQRYIELLDAIRDSQPSFGEPIVVKMDGETIQFDNENDFTDWLSENIT